MHNLFTCRILYPVLSSSYLETPYHSAEYREQQQQQQKIMEAKEYFLLKEIVNRLGFCKDGTQDYKCNGVYDRNL